MSPGAGGRRAWFGLAAGSFIVLALLLPVLLAFKSIALPPAGGEAERVRQSIAPHTVTVSTPTEFFFGMTLPADAAERWPKEADVIVARGRLAGMLALLVVSGLLYILVTMVRGRTTGVLSCLCLCLVPSFAVEGYILRAEQASLMFGLLGVLLLHFYPLALRRRRGQRPLRRWLNLFAIIVCVSLCFGLAASCLPHAGIYLLVPFGALLLVVLCVLGVFPRVVRRRTLDRWPHKAATARFVPWIGMCLGNLALVWLILMVAPGPFD